MPKYTDASLYTIRIPAGDPKLAIRINRVWNYDKARFWDRIRVDEDGNLYKVVNRSVEFWAANKTLRNRILKTANLLTDAGDLLVDANFNNRTLSYSYLKPLSEQELKRYNRAKAIREALVAEVDESNAAEKEKQKTEKARLAEVRKNEAAAAREAAKAAKIATQDMTVSRAMKVLRAEGYTIISKGKS